MVARHEILNIQVWNADASAAIALTPYVSVDVSARADLSIDTLSIVISDKHPAMQLLRTHRNIPVIVSFAVNGVQLSGLVTALKQTKDGKTTVTVSGDSKHAARMLARARSTSAIDGAIAQVEAPVGDLAAQMIGEAAQRTGLPVYILQEHVGDVVQVEIGSEDTIADVLAPVLEASDTFIDMRMLFPGEELPGEGDILRVQGRTEFQWEQDRLAAGAWPQAEAHERLKSAAIMPPTTPMPHLSWSGWAEMGDTGSSVTKTRGVCWMPFDIGQHDRGYWQKDNSHGVRVATVEQLAEARKAGWFEHVTLWSAGTFGDSNDTALRQAVEAELVVKTDGSKISSVSNALSYIGNSAAYAWFDGTYWVLANEADYQAEDAARNPSITQLQTPGVLVHIHAGRDRRNEVLFSATDGGGLEDWQTTTTSPEAAMIHATTQLSQSTLEALQAGTAAIDPVAGVLTPGEASQYVGELPDTVTAIDVNASPFSTVSGTDISRHHLGGAVNINSAGPFFYREMTTSTASNSVNPVAEIGRAYHDAQGSTSIELTPGFTQTSVFGDDVVIDGRVIPGWKPGDRVSFTEGITRISEIVAGFELHAAWDAPLRVTPVLSRADNGVLDTLARRIRQAERDAANALQQNPRRVPKDDVDTVVDNNETVKDTKQVAETANSAAAQAQRSADGKSTIFYGSTTPAKAKAGDTWFKDVAGGGTVLMQYVNGKWVEKVNTKAIDDQLAANDAALAENDAALTELNNVTLPGLKEELEALDTEVAREAASKLAALETKLANADKALKQGLQGELAALDEALSGELTSSLAGLKEELEAADAAGAEAVATTLAQLESRLKDADEKLKTDLSADLAAARKALEKADQAVTTDLSKQLEETRKGLKDASDTIAKDLAEVDSVVSQQRPGNLFPDPFFKNPTWGSMYNAEEECLEITAKGVTTGSYYFPDGYNVYSNLMTLEPGASYLLTIDAQFSVNDVVQHATVYSRYLDAAGAWKTAALGRIERTDEVNYKWGTKSIVLQVPESAASEVTLGFYIVSSYDSGTVRLRNVRLHRAADNSLIIDGAVTAAKVKAGVIDADHIASGAVEADKLAADSVVAGKIATDAVTADSIAANQVTTNKIAADAVTANEIAANAVTANAIKAGEVTADKIAADAVTANKIAADAVSANKLLAEDATIDKLWANGIAAKSVTTNRILVANNGNMLPEISSFFGSGYPDPDPYRHFGKNSGHPSLWLKGRTNAYIFHPINIVAGQKYRLSYQAQASVNGTSHYMSIREASPGGTVDPSEAIKTKLNGSSSESTYLVANGKIGTGWESFDVTFEPSTTEVAYLYIYANHTNGTTNDDGYQWFKDLRLEKMTGATLIEDGAVTTDKIAADAVTANSIAADAVTADAIKAGEVTAEKIATDAVSANNLLAEEATIDKLWSNGLVAKTVHAASMSVGGANLYRDPSLLDPTSFNSRRSDTGGYSGGGSFTVEPSTSTSGYYDCLSSGSGTPTRLDPGATYYISAMVRPDRLVSKGGIRLHLRSYSTADASGSYKWCSPSGISNDVALTGGKWHRIEGTFTMYEDYEYFLLGFYVQSGSQAQAIFSDPMIVRQYSSTMIQDGAITTGKVSADAITANELASDAVTAKAIKAGEISTKHIGAKQVTSDKMTIENGFIKNAMIGNGEVTNAKIANLDAGKITAGTIDANRIGAETITGKHLAVDTIEANQIKANAFTQVANSVLPLIPGTVTPTWTDGLKYIPRSGTKDAELPEGIPGYYRHPSGTIAAGTSVTVTNTYNNVVSIDPNLEYEAIWWVRSSSGSPRYMYVTLEDQNGNTDIVQKVEGVDDNGDSLSKHTWGNPIRVIITSASTTWTKYSTLFTFKEGTKSVRVNNVHFNNGSNSNASYLYIAGLEISPHIIPQREIDTRQDQAINKIEEYVDQMMQAFHSQSASYAKKFNELSEPQSGGLVAGQDEPGIITTTTSKITCQGTWVGHLLVHIMHGTYDGLQVVRREVTASDREFGLPSVPSSSRRDIAIHWFKRPGRAYAMDMSTGAYAMPQGAWTTVSTATVATGDWRLSATVGWDAANNYGYYGIRVLVNGSEVAKVTPRNGLGPLLPIGSGYRTQSLSVSGNGNGRTTKVEIQAYISEGNVSQRRIRKVMATLDWTKLD